jgi:hypothetical protein
MTVLLMILAAVCLFTGDDTKAQPVRDFLRFCGLVVLGLTIAGYTLLTVFTLIFG